MNFLKNIFKAKDEPLTSNADFWTWFLIHERNFYKVLKEKGNIEKDFLNKLSPKLTEVKNGLSFLTGISNDNKAELVITANGSVKNFVFAEELINEAPNIHNWKFTALIPPLDIKDVNIEMAGYKFNEGNLSFYPNEHPDYPDEIDITIVHNDCNEENKSIINNGVFVFLDNFLGELTLADTIDNIEFACPDKAEKELIQIGKLKDYLKWRQKEFIEKYEGIRHTSEGDNYSILDAKMESGNALIAVINTDLLKWDSKASHPWILIIEIPYDGSQHNGLPDEKTYQLLDHIEKKISEELRPPEGFLNIGRQTAKNVREIYFACKDFRKPSKLLDKIQKEYANEFEITYDIFIDKYWNSFDRFNQPN